jgi:hypothetical protein
MSSKVLKFTLIYLWMTLLGLFSLGAVTLQATNVPGSFSVSGGTAPNVEVVLSEIGLFTYMGEDRSNLVPVSTRTNLIPQEEYLFRFLVTDVVPLENLDRVTVKMFYSSDREFTKETVFGSGAYGSGVRNVTDASGLNFVWQWTYDNDTVSQGIVYDSGLSSANSSWSRDLSALDAPSQEFMDAQGSVNVTYDFEVPIQISKIAKLAENRHWHIAILVEKNNNYDTSAFAISTEYGVTWYGEIALDSPGAFVWPRQNFGGSDPLNPMNNVLVGTDFEGSTNQTNLMVRYISNGNYQQTIQASGMQWVSNVGNPLNNGQPYVADLVTRAPMNPQEMAIKFSYSGVSQFNPSLPFLDDQFKVLMEKNSFTSSPEEGDLYDYNLFVSLANVFQNGTYRGVVNIGIRDPFYVILNVIDRDYFAGTTFGQLTQSFGFNSTQEAANAAVIDATSGQTIKLLREINANLFIPMGSISNLANYSSDRSTFILDFDKHRLNGNITIEGFGTMPSHVFLSGLGIISGTLTIDGRELSVTSDAEVMGNTFIRDTSLSSYRITERHHSPIIIGQTNQGRTRIVSTNNAVDAVVHIETIERVYFEGGFERVVFDNNSTSFDFDAHARFDNATVEEIELKQNAEIYIADGSSITSGFITPSGRTARIYLESGATIAGTLVNAGTNGALRSYSTFTGSGTYDLTEFHGNVVNMRTQVSYDTLQTAITFAQSNDVLRVRETSLDEIVYVDRMLTIEGVQRDYSPRERFETFNEAPRFRNRAESVLTNNLFITSGNVSINGMKFDLAQGKSVQINEDNASLEYVWVTKSHVQSGVEAAILTTNVANLTIDQSAFTDIYNSIAEPPLTTTNSNRHAILMSGVSDNITITNSYFYEVDGKNIGVTGTSLSNLQLINNEHNRSVNGSEDNDAVIHIQVNQFTSGLMDDILIVTPYIRSIRINTATADALVESVIIRNVRVEGIAQLNHISFFNSAANTVVSGVQLLNNVLNGLPNQSAIFFDNASTNARYENLLIQGNTTRTIEAGTMSHYLRIDNRVSDSTGVRWNNLQILNNTMSQTLDGVSIRLGSTTSGLFDQLLIQNNNITSQDTVRGVEIILATPNATLLQPMIRNNNINLTASQSIGIHLDLDDNSNTSGGGAQIIDLTISGNNALNATTAVFLDAQLGNPLMQNVRIEDNEIGSLSSAIGIHVYGTGQSIWSGLSMSNNGQIEAYQDTGIYLQAQGTSQWFDVLIHNNSDVIGTTDNDTLVTRRGIHVQTLDEPVFHRLSIQNNNRISGSNTGILIENSLGDGATYHEISIANNNFISGNGRGKAIDVTATNSTDFQSLFINNNGGIASGSNAIDINLTSGGSIDFVIEENSGITGVSNGIRLRATNATTWSGLIQNNQLSGNGANGIFVDWDSGLTIRSGLVINNNRIAYTIGLLSDSYDIDTLNQVTNNTFTSSDWYIKDVTPTLTDYIEIRSGVLVSNNNSYHQEAFISFLDNRLPNGIRPEDQFNAWNENKYFGFLAELSTDDTAQFDIAVNGSLVSENDVIRLRNADDGQSSTLGELTYELFSITGVSPWNVKTHPANRTDFDLLGVSVGTLIGSGNIEAVHTEVFSTTDSNVSNVLNWTSASQLQTILNGPIVPDTNVALRLTGFFVPQETGTYTFTITGDDAVDIIIDDVVIASRYGSNSIGSLGQTNGTVNLQRGVAVSIQIRQQNTAGAEGLRLFWRRPSQSESANWFQYRNELAPADYSNTRFDLPAMDITTSGLRIYSSLDGNPAWIQNVAHADVTAQSGVIFTIKAPSVQLEHLSFLHDHLGYNAPEQEGLVQVVANNTTLSGLVFTSNSVQSISAISILNGLDGTINVDNTLIRGVEIGSGINNTSYDRGITVSALGGPGVISNTLIQSGLVKSAATGTSRGILILNNSATANIDLVTIEGVTFSQANVAVNIANTISGISIHSNEFLNNTTHVSDAGSAISSLRNDVLTGNNNTFLRTVNNNAFVNNALVVDRTITSATQNFINVEKLEAYSTLQAAINDALEGQTIKVRSNATFSDATLSSTNSGTVIVNVSGLTITSVNPPNLATIRNTDASDAPVFDLRASGITVTNIAITRNSGVITSSGTGAVQINNQFITLSGIQFNSDNGFTFTPLNENGTFSTEPLNPGGNVAEGINNIRRWNGYAIRISQPTYVSGIIASASTFDGISSINPGSFQAAFFRAFENTDGTINLQSGIREVVQGTIVDVTTLKDKTGIPTDQTSVEIPISFTSPVLLQPGWYYIAQGSVTEAYSGIKPYMRAMSATPNVNALLTQFNFVIEIHSVIDTRLDPSTTRINLEWGSTDNPAFKSAIELANENSVPIFTNFGTDTSTNPIVVLGFVVVEAQPIDSNSLNNAMNAVGFDNSGLETTSGITITNNSFNGTWASMVEFVNQYDSGIIEATISNNTSNESTRFNN